MLCTHVPCLSRPCVGGEGHGRLVYKYAWSIGCCATCCNTPVPSSYCSLVAFKPLNLCATPGWHPTIAGEFVIELNGFVFL